MLDNRGELNTAVIGASGAIGSAFVNALSNRADVQNVFAASRLGKSFGSPKVTPLILDLEEEPLIEEAAQQTAESGFLDIVIVATGILHDEDLFPEKSLRDLSLQKFDRLFAINTIGPALVAKHFIPKLRRDRPVLFAALSARVGSISDNQLGGWYAYRASKAALNMVLKTISIELLRRNNQSIVVGLHPGTVNSNLSEPFQNRVAGKKLFSPEESVSHLMRVLDRLTSEDTGFCFDWQGARIAE